MSTRDRQRGMTRHELLLGVGSLTMLLWVAGIPGATGEQRLVEMAEARVRASVELAATLARSTRSPHGVVFDQENHRLGVVDATGELAHDPLTKRKTLLDLGRGRLAKDVLILEAHFGRGGNVLVFDGQGVPLSGGHLRLAVGETERTLVVDAATGWIETLPQPDTD